MKRRTSGLGPYELTLFYSTCLILALTGALWLYFDQFVLFETKIGLQKHPMQSFLLMNHGVSSWIFVFLLGWILSRHLPFVWPQFRKRNSGLLLSTLVAVTTLSGFSLYYLGGELSRGWVSLAHWTLGFGFLAVLFLHLRK